LAYLGTMWAEVLGARTYRPRPSSTVFDSVSAIAGVANIGSDRNWSGSHFDQANWYAFGRLAWNPDADPRSIAGEWTRMTWSNDPRVARPIVAMMMSSHQAVVDYMTPLGLAHLMGGDHHYGPAPWETNETHPSWAPIYYHRADRNGIGFDRTAGGSNAVAQYAPEAARLFGDSKRVSDEYLLWFHHVPWTHRMRSGRTLWEELVAHYDRGVGNVAEMRRDWEALRPLVDAQRHCEVAAALAQQEKEARWWRDASIAYWQSLNQLALPEGRAPPERPLDWYKALKFETVPGFLIPRIRAPARALLVREIDHASLRPCSRPHRLRDCRFGAVRDKFPPGSRRPPTRCCPRLHRHHPQPERTGARFRHPWIRPGPRPVGQPPA
ncbi:MAG TPA: hypothetical protein VEB39_06360, partial [Sphingomicrobium sp.]|nr:hypothetical protein [Sphingomicrobium sp.]